MSTLIALFVVIAVIAVVWALVARRLGDRARPMKKGDWPGSGPGPGTFG